MDSDIALYFLGVFAADTIPKNLPHSYLLITNTDPISEPGQHWILLFKRDVSSPSIFFDSYGKKPSYYSANWCKYDDFKRSNEDFQQEHTDVCGDHCLYVGKHLSVGHTFENILRNYDPLDKKGNDEQVFALVHGQYRILNSIKHDTIGPRKTIVKYQGCRARREEL